MCFNLCIEQTDSGKAKLDLGRQVVQRLLLGTSYVLVTVLGTGRSMQK